MISALHLALMASNAFALVRFPSDKDNKTIRIEWTTVGTEVRIPQEQAGTVQSKLNWTRIGPYRDITPPLGLGVPTSRPILPFV